MKSRLRGALLLVVLVAACGRPAAEDVDDQRLSGVRPVLKYEPALVSVQGTIDTIFQYGPPGFGENPAVDEHVIVAVLRLNGPIDVEGDSTSAYNRDAAIDIKMLQLVAPNDRPWAAMMGKEVSAYGKLFHSQATQHYTEVLLNVDSVVPEPAR